MPTADVAAGRLHEWRRETGGFGLPEGGVMKKCFGLVAVLLMYGLTVQANAGTGDRFKGGLRDGYVRNTAKVVVPDSIPRGTVVVIH